ncbi:MAG: hypothetical protein NTX29_17015 [Actinobacteria bacterium]|nr:hypothetical protein [Actinomycetota bacterium]
MSKTSPTSTTPRRRGRTALTILTAASIAVLGLVALGATPAEAAATCPDGYSLNGGSCEKYERVDATPGYGECEAPETNFDATRCELVVEDSWTERVRPGVVNTPGTCAVGMGSITPEHGDACYTFERYYPYSAIYQGEYLTRPSSAWSCPEGYTARGGSADGLICQQLIPGSTTYPERPRGEDVCPAGWTGPLEGETSYCERTLVTTPNDTTGGTFAASETARGSVDFCLADGVTTLVVDYSGTGVGASTVSQADANYAASTVAVAAAEAARAAKTPTGARLGACGAPVAAPAAPAIVPVSNVSAPAAATVAVPAAATVPAAVPAGDGSQAPVLPMWALALLTAGILGTAVAGKRVLGARQ